MNARDESIEDIHAALKHQHLNDGLAALWEDLKPDEAVTGAEIAKILRADRTRIGMALLLLKTIERTLDHAAENRANDEAESVYRDLHQKPQGLLHGAAKEEAEDLS